MAAALAHPDAPPTDPLAMLAVAVQQGADPDKLDKLLTLHERVTKAKAEQAYTSAMVACQAELPVVARDGSNPQTKSKYAKLETVILDTADTINKHGFSVHFGEAECKLDGWKRNTLQIRHVGGHCETFHLDLPLDGVGAKGNAIGGMNAVQGAVSTGSYGMRVTYCRAFRIIIADSDNDGVKRRAATESELAAIREAHGKAYGENDDDSRFWEWLKVEPGNFSDIPTAKLPDVLTNLKRKAAQRKAVVS